MNSLYVITAWLTVFSSAIMCVVVYLKNAHVEVNKRWAVMSITIIFWSVFLSQMFSSKNAESGLFFSRLLTIGSNFIPVTFYHFVLAFLGLEKNIRQKRILRIGYATSFIFLLFTFSHLFVKSVSYKPLVGCFYPDAGPMYIFYIFLYFFFMGYPVYLLYKISKASAGQRKNQILYIVIASILGFMGGSTTFPLWYQVQIPPLGAHFVWLYTPTIAFAILRYRLMDIRVALTRVGVFFIVYVIVLGIPFLLGYKFGLWKIAAWITVFLATSGPFAFIYLSRRTEVRLFAEAHHAREVLKQAATGMMHYKSIKELTNIIVRVTTKTLKLENASVFLWDEKSGNYKLEFVRFKSKYHYLDSLSAQDALVQRLSTLDEPLVYEEVRILAQSADEVSKASLGEIISQVQSLSAQVIVPAISSGRLVGFLVLSERKSKQAYSKEDLDILQLLSYQAALAIENAQFHQQIQEQALKENREMTASFIGHGASHQFKNILNKILQHSKGKEMDIDELDLNSLSQEELKALVISHKEEFQAISLKVNQAAEIVAGILSLGSGSPVDFKQVDLKEVVQHSIQAIKLTISKESVQKLSAIPQIKNQLSR